MYQVYWCEYLGLFSIYFCTKCLYQHLLKIIKEIKRSQTVQYLDELDEIIKNNDENFDNLSEEDEILISKAIDLIKSSNKASTSYLQRNFQVGYNKAARIMEALEQRGVVSQPNHTGKREILINT